MVEIKPVRTPADADAVYTLSYELIDWLRKRYLEVDAQADDRARDAGNSANAILTRVDLVQSTCGAVTTPASVDASGPGAPPGRSGRLAGDAWRPV